MQRFQQLKASGAGISLGTNYLEGGFYAEAVVSTGAEANLVDRGAPEVKFIDVTEIILPAESRWAAASSGPLASRNSAGADGFRPEPIVLFDFDGDGDLDIFDSAGSQRLLRNDSGKFSNVTAQSGLWITSGRYVSAFAAIAGDYDNDSRLDLFVSRLDEKRFLLYHNDGGGHFSDRTKQAALEVPKSGPPFSTSSFADLDHDGDLDLFVGGPSNLLFRNNGNGNFTDIAKEAGVATPSTLSAASTIIPTDFDNRRDVDLFMLPNKEPPRLFRNMRDGTFGDVAKEIGLPGQSAFWCATSGDLNKDGFADFFVSNNTQAFFAMSDGRGHFKLAPAPSATRQSMAAQFLDFDNDGLLDLLTITGHGVCLSRNVGEGFQDFSDRALPITVRNVTGMADFPESFPPHTALASGDLDGDGDVDLILRDPRGSLLVLRNDGGNRNRSIKVDLHGKVSNRSAIAAKVRTACRQSLSETRNLLSLTRASAS
jgi:hypothetical protein